MPSSLSRSALSVALVSGLAIGCASQGKPSARTEPAKAPSVTSDDIDRSRGQPIEEVLQSKVPGLIVTRTTNGGIAVNIRGSQSFFSGTEPLYVIDGMPVNPGPGGALVGVNPYDIDTIKVLKDPSETALYGVRGANGVIVVTMKKAGK
jgi:TonB-dependent SusC/RagA subfamily outer membrane receptor